MESYGWLSILPPILAIGLAIKTKQVYLSLALFVFLGWTIMSGWNPVEGMIQSLDAYIESVTDADNARVLLFSVLIGAMITFTQASGGMNGFVTWVERSGLARSRRSVGLLTGSPTQSIVCRWVTVSPGTQASPSRWRLWGSPHGWRHCHQAPPWAWASSSAM